MTLPYSKDDFDGLTPSRAHPDSKDVVGELVNHLNDVRGTATIAAAAASVNVDVDPALHGLPLLAALNGVYSTGAADATATSLESARWSASVPGRFTIAVNAAATADVRVSYAVFAE